MVIDAVISGNWR